MTPWRKFALAVALAGGVHAAFANEHQLGDIEKRAAQDEVAALVELGESQERGVGGKEQVGKAHETYRLAASRGSKVALVRLGMLYEYGHGVPQSYEKARAYYEEADAAAQALATYRLGLLHMEGWGVAKDQLKAVEYFERAAQKDYAPAMKTLAYIYHFGIGAKADARKGVQWAERAAALKDAEGEFLAGATRLSARDLETRSVPAGRQWLSKSAEKEYTRSMLVLAGSYLNGAGGPRDPDLAKRWLELALESGDSDAGFLLALHENFVGGPQRTPSAEVTRKYLETAASLGNFTAREVLELEKEGRSFREGLHYVMMVPQITRYVNRASKTAGAFSTEGNRPPQVIHTVETVYPVALRFSGMEGEVAVQFVVDTDGTVLEPKAISSTHPAFTDAALLSVSQWRFIPAFRNGTPVKAKMQVPMHFQLNMLPKPGGARRAQAK